MPHSTFPGSCSSEEEGTQQQQQQQQEQQPPQPEQQQDQEHQDQEQRQRQQSLSHLVSPTPTPSSYTSSPSSSSTSSPFNSSTSSPVLRPSSPATLANINTSTSTSTSTINITTTTTTDTITTNTTNQQPPSAVTMTALAPLSSSHQSAFFKLSTFPTPSTKRSLPQKHIRSKSTNTLQSYHPFSTIPSSFSRPNAPPLLRSTSLPPINSFAELSSSPASSRFTLTTCPPSPISPRTRVPRSNSPTRQWAYSQSPRGSGGVNYHSGSAFSHSPPPSYLVNEPYVASSSSGSSTPTSVRSRSPSISSLETIPDSPDAEAEEELRAKEELAAAVVVVEEEVASRRGSGRRAAADKRKRWSVCGGEKRGDLELETIWEDGADALGISVGDGMGRGEMI